MEKEIRENNSGKIFTLFKDSRAGTVELMCEETKYMKLTKFVKEVHLDSIETCDRLVERKKNEFKEEIENNCRAIPPHPQILNLMAYDIALIKEEMKIIYSIYYNEPVLIPLAQYFYKNKDSPSSIMNCFFKIGSLFQELSEIVMLKLSLLNIYVNEKEEIVLILPPFPFFHDENNIDSKEPNISVMLPPENQDEMTL